MLASDCIMHAFISLLNCGDTLPIKHVIKHARRAETLVFLQD